jgi:hypothetical protein
MTASAVAAGAAAPDRGTTAMTALGFVPRPKRWRLRLTLLAGQLYPSVELAALSFIHLATWAVVRQPGLPWDGYLLFVSNFSGDSDEYIANFADVIPDRVNKSFGMCEGFPGAQPSPAFIHYVNERLHFPDVYYSAYPDATVRDVGAASRVSTHVERLRRSARRSTPAQFAADFRKALHATQAKDAKDPTPERRFKLIARAWSPAQVSSLSVIFPVQDGLALDRALGALDDLAATTLFDGIHGTHFARLVRLASPARPREPSLLFSAQVDGTPANYIERLRMGGGPALDAVWASCARYPGVADPVLFRDWFEFSAAPSSLFIAESQMTVEEVRDALKRHRQFRNFAVVEQGVPPEDLLAAFQRAFG